MMPKILFRTSLPAEGVAGVPKEGGTAGQNVVGDAITKLGGNMEAFYFAFGDEDVVVVAELPDDETAAASACSELALIGSERGGDTPDAVKTDDGRAVGVVRGGLQRVDHADGRTLSPWIAQRRTSKSRLIRTCGTPAHQR